MLNNMKNKTKKKIITTSNGKILLRGNIDIPNTSIHTFSCFWLDACTYITSGTVKLAL
jgi:hypothetical protein